MKLGIIFCTLTFLSFGMQCNDLRSKEIYTYLASDNEILFENIRDDIVKCKEVQAYPKNWMEIPNAFWIWRRALSSQTANFMKEFYVAGKIISGKFDYLVDQTLENLQINGLDAQIIKNSGYTTINQIDVTNLLRTGINNLNLTVKAESINITGGITFMLRIVSQVLV